MLLSFTKHNFPFLKKSPPNHRGTSFLWSPRWPAMVTGGAHSMSFLPRCWWGCRAPAHRELLFILHSLFLQLQGSTSPPTVVYPSGTSWDGPWSARTQQALISLVWLQGVHPMLFCSSCQHAPAPPVVSAPWLWQGVVYRAFPPEFRQVILPFVGLGMEQELLGKGLRAWRCPSGLI